MVLARLSIRARLTATFAAVLAGLFLTLSGLLVVVVHATLTSSAQQRVAAVLADSTLRFVKSWPASDDLNTAPDVVIQVTDWRITTVWAASGPLHNAPILVTIPQRTGRIANWEVGLRHSALTEPYVTGLGEPLVDTVMTKRGRALLFGFYAGPSVSHSVGQIVLGLVISIPLLLAVLSWLIWLGLGATLAPVESIRRRVAAIAASDLSERVPVTPGDDEIARLSRTLNDMLARLDVSARGQQEFISNASHELRSPLTTLLITVDQAASNPDRANWPTVADTVAREGRRLQHLIDDLFWLARADEGGHPLTLVDVDLDDILFDEARRVRELSDLHVDVRAVQPVRVRADLDMAQRLVRNVVDNAARHAERQLTFSTSVSGEAAVVTVADDGPGVDASTAESLFGRFVRADESRSRRGGGTGLGLAIVAEITRRHGGSVRFVSVESGATVEIRLPIGGPRL